jgi:hypothetical protein
MWYHTCLILSNRKREVNDKYHPYVILSSMKNCIDLRSLSLYDIEIKILYNSALFEDHLLKYLDVVVYLENFKSLTYRFTACR